jgi:anti-sigma factor RsiW
MRCDDVVMELDAFSTGELEAEKRVEIERHIRECPVCRTELARILKENDLFREYGAAASDFVQPENIIHDAKIKSSVERIPLPGRRTPSAIPKWFLAAAAMLLMAAGLSWYFFTHAGAPDMAHTTTPAPPIRAAVPMDQALHDLEKAIASLQTSYSEKKPHLDPKLVKELDRNLEVTRAAIHECKQALKENPGNGEATEFLLLDYEKHIEILKKISEDL